MLALLRKQDANPHQGGEIRRMFMGGDRYCIDFAPELRAWRQYDTEQDASYFGVWVQLEERAVLTFAEGDWSLWTAPDDPTLASELQRMGDFYGSPPPAWVGLEADGTRTEGYDPRPTVGGAS